MAHFLTPWALTLKVILFMGMTSQLQAVIGSQLKMVTGEIPHLITQTGNPWEFPCPAPEKIQPCVCSVEEGSQMTMDCSKVTSKDELKSILNQEFSFTNFKELRIVENDHIYKLLKGDLGNCTFEEIRINYCSLTEIEEGALEGSYDTLLDLDLYRNSLTTLLDISHFTRLMEISISDNFFKQFPTMVSSTVSTVHFNFHRMEAIPVKALKGLPSLKEFYMKVGPLTSIPSGTFTFSEQLNKVYLGHNNLTTLPKNTVQLYGHFGDRTTLDLSDNDISYLPKEAISGVDGYMSMFANNMKELDEEMWRPFLENNVELNLAVNPFGCGCDIAWLVLNTTLMDRLDGAPTCYNGVRFTDLDPTVYEDLC